MSPRLAVVLYVGLCAASVALWLHEAINRAVAWVCPCGDPHR